MIPFGVCALVSGQNTEFKKLLAACSCIQSKYGNRVTGKKLYFWVFSEALSHGEKLAILFVVGNRFENRLISENFSDLEFL